MKKFILAVFIILICAWFFQRNWRNSDFKLGIITPNEIALLSISPQRGMINLLTLDGEVEVWLPGGMGWYQSNKINKIYEIDKDIELMRRMFHYNFGFLPEKIMFMPKVDEWRGWTLVRYLGVVDWLRYVFEQDAWLYKAEKLFRSMEMEKEQLDEILPRDFSDSELLNEEIKISVVNDTEENGLGSFVADRLNWMGFSVMEVRSEMPKKECELMVNVSVEGVVKKYTDILAKEFKCSLVSNTTLLSNEAVLYLGQNYASMIKYNSYVRTF